MTDYTVATYPKAAIFNLLVATLFNFFIAFLPLWLLAAGANMFDRFIGMFLVVFSDSSMHFSELLQAFWLPFVSGLVCLGALILVLVTNPRRKIGRFVFFFPLAIISAIFLYVLITRLDIHILSVSLIPLISAWWIYYKQRRGKSI